MVSIGAIALSLPFGVAVAIYMAEIANTKTRNLLKRRYRLKYLKSKLFTNMRKPCGLDVKTVCEHLGIDSLMQIDSSQIQAVKHDLEQLAKAGATA